MGSGDTAPPMIASLAANIFKVAFASYFVSVLGWGANWVWLAISLSVVVEMAIIVLWYRQGNWKLKQV